MRVFRGIAAGRWRRLAGMAAGAALVLAAGGVGADIRFQPAVAYPVTGADYGLAVDLDQDGKLDIVGANQGAGIFVLYGRGDGTFEPAVYLPVADGILEVIAADLNKDGRLDLVAC